MTNKLFVAFLASVAATGALALPAAAPLGQNLQPRAEQAQNNKNDAKDSPQNNYVTFDPSQIQYQGAKDGSIPLGIGDERAQFCQHSCGIQLCPCDDGGDGLRWPNDGGDRGRNMPYIQPGFGPGPVILPDNRYPKEAPGWNPYQHTNPSGYKDGHQSTGCGSQENPCPFYPTPIDN